MRPDTDMSALIDGIYDAAIDGSLWATALKKLARAMRADAHRSSFRIGSAAPSGASPPVARRS